MSSSWPKDYGFCVLCGTPRTRPDQAFCGRCGTPISGVPPSTSATPMPSVAPTAATSPRAGINPILLLVGGLVVVAIVVAVAIVALRGRSGGSEAPGNVTFSVSTFSCSNPPQGTFMTTHLPSSVRVGDTLTYAILGGTEPAYDGIDTSQTFIFNPSSVNSWSSGFVQESDGSWVAQDPYNRKGIYCTNDGQGWTMLGTHTVRWLDAGSKVLAEGTFTVTP